MINLDAELTTTVNDLLRTEPRLLVAAPLVGKVAALYRDPKPEPEAAPPKADDKKLPPRVDGSSPAAEESGEVTAKPPGPAAIPSPWHSVVVLSKADGLAKFPPDLFSDEAFEYDRDNPEDGRIIRNPMNGGPILAKVTIDGTMWERLDGVGQRAALVHALRGLRHKTRASDDADLAVVEKPPIRTWPDVREEATQLMTQLGPDGAEGAALVNSLAMTDMGEALDEAIAAFKRRLDAGQDMRGWYGQIGDLQANLDDVVFRIAAQIDPPVRDMDTVHPAGSDA